MLKKLVIGIMVVAIVAIIGIYVVRNTLVEHAVEEGSTYALGVETNLGSASLNLMAGNVGLDDFVVPNPEGFEDDNFLVMERGVVDVETGSVFDDELTVDSLIFEGVRLSFEQVDGKGNYAVFLDNLKRLDMGSSGGESDQKIRIKHAAIRDIEVSAALTVLNQKRYDKTLTVDNFAMENIGGDDGASIEAISAQILQRIISEASAAARNKYPDMFKAKISEMAEDKLKDVESEVKDKLKDAAGSLLGGD